MIITTIIVIIMSLIINRRMFHWTEDEYARLTTFTSLLSVFSSLVLLPILRSDEKDKDKDKDKDNDHLHTPPFSLLQTEAPPAPKSEII